jgi:flagellar basal-body rod modification protein FlgD
MATSFIGSATLAANNLPDLSQNAASQEDFLRIMLTQLRFQDPLKPVDNQQFLAQMAQFSALAASEQMNTKLESLLTLEASTQAVGLLGRTVQVNNAQNGEITVGKVTSLVLGADGVTLTVLQESGALLTGVNPAQVTVVR